MVSRILETGKNDIRARLTPGYRLFEERENMRGMTGKSIRRQLQEIIVLAIVIFAILCARSRCKTREFRKAGFAVLFFRAAPGICAGRA